MSRRTQETTATLNTGIKQEQLQEENDIMDAVQTKTAMEKKKAPQHLRGHVGGEGREGEWQLYFLFLPWQPWDLA